MGRAFEYRKAAKLKRWDTMSKVFPKLGKIITMAAKEGGIDPNMNAKLRTAIINAKAQNMPKEKIEAAIKRANSKDLADIKELSYEAKAKYGVLLIIDCATDNSTRTIANVRAILARNDAETLKNGSLDFMFTKKSVFMFYKRDDIDMQELELELIDFGLELIEEDKEPSQTGKDREIIRIIGEFSSFGELSKELENRDIAIIKAEIQKIANNPIALTEKEMQEITILVDKLENDDDVQAVYTNIN